MDSTIEVRLTPAALANATKITAQFTLTGPSGPVAGTISIGSSSGTFSPSARLERFSRYDARIILNIEKTDGSMVTEDYSWSFHTAWTQIAMSDVGGTVSANGIAFDGTGNIYVAGYADGNFDGNLNVNTTDRYASDHFLIKYDLDGQKLWSRQFGTVGDDFTGGAALDGAGNVYIAGTIGDGGLGTSVSLTKFDANGNLLWTRSAGVSGFNIFVKGVAVDAAGNAVIAGAALTSTQQIFLIKYDSSGVQQWFNYYSDRYYAYSQAVRVDADGNIYVVGTLAGIWADPGHITDSRSFMLLAKYDPQGVKQWDQLLAPTDTGAGGNDVALDSQGNVYVAGSTGGALAGTSYGGQDFFIAKYSSNGTLQYVRQNGSTDNDYTAWIAIDENDDVYVMGLTDGVMDPASSWRPGSPFMAKYGSTGTFLWARQRPIYYGNYRFGADKRGHVFQTGHGFSLVDGNNDVMRDALVTFRFDLEGIKN
jgi:hypothetical protein